MHFFKKFLAVAALVAMASAVFYAAAFGTPSERTEDEYGLVPYRKTTVNLWYTDESLGDFLASAALSFSEGRDIRVIPRLVSGLEYLETINRETMTSESIPDLFLVGNDSLEKAYQAGLACEVKDDDFVNTEQFPETALRAVTYFDKIIGYPFSYETSALIYNKTYLEEHVKRVLEAEADASEGEEAMENSVFQERLNAVIPSSVEGILAFADSYEAPEQVQAVFKWDVNDIFYNYFFVGNFVEVGGPNGDNMERIDIYNLDTIRCMQSYQQMSEYFSIEAENVEYSSVLQEFLEGRLVYMLATTDALTRIELARKDGTFPYEYGVTNVPNIDGELLTRGMSETQVVAINGYGKNKALANEFARYLTGEAAQTLFEKTGKLPANKNADLLIPQAEAFYQEYKESVPVPKMMATSNYWVLLEVAFTKIWSGDDVSRTLQELSEQIMTQVTGVKYTEEYIQPPAEAEAVNWD